MLNPNLSDKCKLVEGEQYCFIFHVGNIKDIKKPKKWNGETMCMRFHSVAYCFRDFRFAKGHGELDPEETGEVERFLGKARAAQKKFQENQRDRQGYRPRTVNEGANNGAQG